MITTLDCKTNGFPKVAGGPGKLIFVIGPAGIGKTSLIEKRAEIEPVVLHKEDTYTLIDEEFQHLDNYERSAMSRALLSAVVIEELERRRRSPKRRKQLFIVEACAMTKVAQAHLALLATRWVGLTGTAQVVCLWPGKPTVAEDGTKLYLPDEEGFTRYLQEQARQNDEDERIARALGIISDFDISHPKFRYPWDKDGLLRAKAGIFEEMARMWQSWYH